MAVQPADISAILNAFGQLGQSNSLLRQRRDAAEAAQASTRGAIGGIAGGIAGGMVGGPMGAAAGSAAGSQLLSGGKASGAQTISQAGQAYQMGQGQQAYEQQQADRAALTQAANYLNPQPQIESSSVNTPAFNQFSDAPEGAPPSTPAMSRGTMEITQKQPNIRGAIGSLMQAGQVGPALSLMAQEGRQGQTIEKEVVRDGKTYYQSFQQTSQGLQPVGSPYLKQEGSSKGQDDPYFPGTGLDTSATRNINNIAPKIKAGTANEQEVAAYTTSWNQLTTPSVFQDAEGNQMIRPAKDLSRFPQPPQAQAQAAPQGGGQQPAGGYPAGTRQVDNKPLPVEQAAKIAMVDNAIKTHASARQAILTPEGGFDRQTIATMNANIPFTQGRALRQSFKDSIEARLRAESGAAVPDSEVERAMERFMPSTLDSDAAIKSKLDRFENWLKDTQWMTREGRAPQPEAPKQTKKSEALKNKYGLE